MQGNTVGGFLFLVFKICSKDWLPLCTLKLQTGCRSYWSVYLVIDCHALGKLVGVYHPNPKLIPQKMVVPTMKVNLMYF